MLDRVADLFLPAATHPPYDVFLPRRADISWTRAVLLSMSCHHPRDTFPPHWYRGNGQGGLQGVPLMRRPPLWGFVRRIILVQIEPFASCIIYQRPERIVCDFPTVARRKPGFRPIFLLNQALGAIKSRPATPQHSGTSCHRPSADNDYSTWSIARAVKAHNDTTHTRSIKARCDGCRIAGHPHAAAIPPYHILIPLPIFISHEFGCFSLLNNDAVKYLTADYLQDAPPSILPIMLTSNPSTSCGTVSSAGLISVFSH